MPDDSRVALLPRAGEKIGPYLFVPEKIGSTSPCVLGRGGSGVVFRVSQDLAEGVQIERALKIFLRRDHLIGLPHHSESGPVSSSDFFKEIRALAVLNHENVLRVVDSGKWTPPKKPELSVPYIVSDLIEGADLGSLLRGEHSDASDELAGEKSIDVVLQLCAGVAFLHRNEYFHCDIKPDNIFLRRADAEGGSVHVVVGDLGVGKFRPSPNDKLIVIGTRAYMPPSVAKLRDELIDGEAFMGMQPTWDVFGAAKTSLEFLEATSGETFSEAPWYVSLVSVLQSARDNARFQSIDALRRAIDWCHPKHYQIGNVRELGSAFEGSQPTLIAVEAATTSHSIRELANHPAMTRLKRVPQIFMGPAVLLGATHTRLEHCVGSYQVARRYLRALLNDPKFLSVYSPEWGSTFLVASLLYGLGYFPLSPVFSELRASGEDPFPSLSGRNAIEELFDLRSVDGCPESLREILDREFPHVDSANVQRLISGDRFADAGPMQRCIAYLLGSSVDVRVLDYLRRDAVHLGIGHDSLFDLNGLFQFMRFDGEHIAFGDRGIQTLEQLVSLRQWLFARIYWNGPNRTLIAMVSEAMMSLRESGGIKFEERLRSRILFSRNHELLSFVAAEARRTEQDSLIDLATILQKDRPVEYRVLAEYARAADPFPTDSPLVCDGVAYATTTEMRRIRGELDRLLRQETLADESRINILIDYPRNPGRPKLGEDVKVYRRDGGAENLRAISGIVAGAQDTFHNHLRRVRLLLHPAVDVMLVGDERSRVAEVLRRRLLAEFQ